MKSILKDVNDITWGRARKKVGAIRDVVRLIQAGPADTRGKRNMAYKIELTGKQRRASIPGEGKIEAQLLSARDKPKLCLIMKDRRKLSTVRFMSNAFGIGARRRGNVFTDLFGLDKKNSPVCGEVKIKADNPWSAVVQCSEQVALLRSDRKFFSENIRAKNKAIKGTGTWGLIIAPPKYWDKREITVAKRLVKRLREKTKVRICCVSYDDTALKESPVILKVVCGRPPLC